MSSDKLNAIRKANEALKGALKNCRICPRRCGVNRLEGKKGYCRAPGKAVVYSYSPHHGEEPPLSGTKGSGTLFFSHCNMKCAYCQNYRFSQLDNGNEVEPETLVKMTLYLQRIGCHNINLVSPTHFVPQILLALEIAVKEGLHIPIVYNTGGYDSLDTIKLLDGIVDIYMPDMRYSDNEASKWYSDAPDYVEHNRECVTEMQRQVGDLVLDAKGIAKKGLIIRLLVLPENVSGTNKSLIFIKETISENAYLSIMSQYYPTYKTYDYREISRQITTAEYKNVVDEAKSLGLNNGWVQEGPIEFEKRFLGTNIPPKHEI
ncbi:MAG: radical SAM protein [Omnitrophica bacterium RIFCSPLOWO2_01_FULL_45_10]|nr:MAG: radical SAM protein [Omnitrophica bacterium RIFCSPLOWO2_01_FULL_45_10]